MGIGTFLRKFSEKKIRQWHNKKAFFEAVLSLNSLC